MSDTNQTANRTYPYTAIAEIVAIHANGTALIGTGTFVSPNRILTAAHLLTSDVTQVLVVPGASGYDIPLGVDEATSWTAYENLTGKTKLDSAEASGDLGVISLSDNLGDKTGWFDIAQGLFTSSSVAANISGYPDVATNMQRNAVVQVSHDPAADVVDYSGGVAPGSSGGPIWLSGGPQPTLGGVVSTTGYGALLTGATYQWVEQQIATDTASTAPPPFLLGGYIPAGPESIDLDTDSLEGGGGEPIAIPRQAPLLDAPIDYNQEQSFAGNDSILAGPDDAVWFIGGDGRALSAITWDPTVGYHDASFQMEFGRQVFSGPDTMIWTSDIGTERFIDGTLSFDPDAAPAQITRAYLVALGRAPDPLGLEYWNGRLSQGSITLDDVVQGLLTSPEYAARYGTTLSDGAFLTEVYQNALGRAPDPDGYAYWLGQLETGLSRAAVLVGFSESAEYKASTAAVNQAGIYTPDSDAANIARLYHTAFDRAPDRAGFVYNLDQAKAGTSLADLANQFIASTEFTTRYGNTSNQQFVDLLYQNALGRGPDTSGEQFWINQIQSGAQTRAGVVLAFSNSPEQEARLVPMIDQSGVGFLS